MSLCHYGTMFIYFEGKKPTPPTVLNVENSKLACRMVIQFPTTWGISCFLNRNIKGPTHSKWALFILRKETETIVWTGPVSCDRLNTTHVARGGKNSSPTTSRVTARCVLRVACAEVCAGCATAWMSCIHKKPIYKLYKWKAMLIFRQRLNRYSILV